MRDQLFVSQARERMRLAEVHMQEALTHLQAAREKLEEGAFPEAYYELERGRTLAGNMQEWIEMAQERVSKAASEHVAGDSVKSG